MQEERRAQSRIDDILGSKTRGAVANHNLIEIVRTTKDRQPKFENSDLLNSDDESSTENNKKKVWKPISKGRSLIEQEIFVKAKEELSQLGIRAS